MPSLMATLGLNISGFHRGISEAQTNAKELGKALAGSLVKFGSIAGIEEVVRQTAEYADKVGDLSSRLGMSSDEIQQWDNALKLNGSSIEEAVPFFEKLGVARMKALRGNEEMVTSFMRLGVSIQDLKSKGAGEIAQQIGQHAKGGDPQALIADLKAVGGKGAGSMMALMTAGISEAVGDMQTLGTVIDRNVVASLKESVDQAKLLKMQMAATVAPAAAKGLAWYVNSWRLIADLASNVKDTFKAQFAGGFFHAFTKEGREAGADAMMENARQRENRLAKEKTAQKELLDRLQGKRSPKEIEEEESKSVTDLRDKLAAKNEANALAEMTSQQKLLYLEQKRAEVNERIAAAKSEKERLEGQVQLADVEKDIWNVGKGMASEEAKGSSSKLFRRSLNANQQMGAYAAGPDIASLDSDRKRERHLEQINKNIAILVNRSGASGAEY